MKKKLKKFIVFPLIIELKIAFVFTFTACEIDESTENGGVIITYNISGNGLDSYTGFGLEDVTMILSGDVSDSTNTDASGNYSFSGLTNGSYIVTPSLTNYSFEPTSSKVTVSGANVANVDFVGTAEVSNACSVSGTITDSDTGFGLEDVTMILSGDVSDSTNTDASGNYSFSGLTNGSYIVTPSLTTYSFEPTSSEVTVSGADVANVDFVGTAEVSNTYSISGTIRDNDTGFGLPGITMTLSGDASDTTTSNASGNYAFSDLPNGSYTITPSLTKCTFTPTNSEVTISGAEVTNVDFIGTAEYMSRLHVDGKNIVNESGKKQILRGVAVIDPFFMKEVYKNGPSEADFITLAEEWNVDIVRVPIHPDLWLQNQNYLKEYVDPIVHYARRYGFYAFLGYHAHGNPITNEVDLPDWRFVYPWTGNPYNPDLDVAIDALTKMVERYKNDPGVLYGTFNEPSFITWQQWRPIAENLVDVIHSIESKAVVFVSGVDSGYDLSQVINDPVNRPNVIYETHPYPWKGEAWKNDVPILSEHYPVFIGEWGFGTSGGGAPPQGDVDSYGKPLLNFAEQLELGWTAWIWHDEWSPSMLTTEGTLTDFGTLVKEALTNK